MAPRTMPSGGTVVRARKHTQAKGKVPSPQPATATTAKTTATPRNGNRVQVTQYKLGNSSHHSTLAQTAISAPQSSDVVQTFLFSAVSTILWMRDLLPDEYFRTAFYASINKHCSYHDFTQGCDDGAIVQGDRARPKGYHLRVLKRNSSTRGDQIIKWLEMGVFEAIKLGYLGQLQISIFADEERPTEMLELYCFYFQYSGSLQDGSLTVGLEVEDIQNKKTISLKDARGALNTVVKNMVGINGTMPHLPERCFMCPYLVWNERRPSSYQPPGFHPSNDGKISFPNTEGWTMEINTCGQVKTGFQAVDFGIAYTKGVTLDDDGDAVVMPTFTYGEELSRLEPLGIQINTLCPQEKTPESRARDLPTPRPSSVVGGGTDLATPTARTRHSPTSVPDNEIKILPHMSIEVGADTQDKEDLSRLKALQPIEPHQTHDTQLVYRQPTVPSQYELSTATTQELHGERGATESPRRRKSLGSEPPEVVFLSCECGTKEMDNIVQCRGCDRWQHAQCYAFDGPDDTRMSTEHRCYTCLVGNVLAQLDEARKLARTRQVIHCIQVRGLNSPSQISKTLGYTRVEVVKLLEELKLNNIVLLKNLKKTSEHVSLIATEASKRALTQIYLDPSRSIEELIEDAAAAGRTIHSTPGRKRKDHGPPDDEVQPKTPRLSRPYPTLAFDSNAPYTPESVSFAGQTLD